ncbi:hypothetical protein LCGC14_2602480 [marine sediment metagenome]|uniref:Uncharacterized protein n=1 Tax=marine sediment metagenome TaxID=412755 RepID=A0A0F9AW31_9ZZZZ
MKKCSVRLGPEMKRALKFISQVNGWHSFDNTTKQPIMRLAKAGMVEVNAFNQFRRIRGSK